MEKAIAAICRLPEDRQDKLAEKLLAAADNATYTLTANEQAAVDEGLADPNAGRFVSDAQVDDLFSKHRPG